MRLLPSKPTLVILTLAALMKAPDAMPAFKNYKVLDWQSIPAVLDFTPRKNRRYHIFLMCRAMI